MVETAMAIEREVDEARRIRDAETSGNCHAPIPSPARLADL